MAIFKFAVMVTDTTHYLKEVEVEADSLDAAKTIMQQAETRFEDYNQTHFHWFVGDIDHGYVAKWEQGQLTDGEQKELFPVDHHFHDETMRNPCLTPVYRVDWIERLTPEQIANEQAEHQKWLDDPKAQARFNAFRVAFGFKGG